MARIDSVSVIGRGPVVRFEQEMKPLTLIYSKNEAGKTAIVEALTETLFAPGGAPLPRSSGFPAGKTCVAVSGISSGPVVFNDSSNKKLDDVLASGETPLSPGLMKLLYVRASCASVSTPGETQWDALRDILSCERELETVINNIPGESGYARVENGRVTGARRGASGRIQKEIYPLLEELGRARLALEDISFGELRKIESDISVLKEHLELLGRARQHYAWLQSILLEKLQQEASPERLKEIEMLGENISEYRISVSRLCDLKEKTLLLEKELAERPWLEAAAEKYSELSGRGLMLFPALLGLLAGIALLFVLSGALFPAAFVLGASVICALYLLISGVPVRAGRLKEIKDEFRLKFGEEASGIAIESRRREMDMKTRRISELGTETEKALAESARLKETIKNAFAGFGLEPVPEESLRALRELKDKHYSMLSEAAAAKARLDELCVSPGEYLLDDPGLLYSATEEKRLNDELALLYAEKGVIEQSIDREKYALKKMLNVHEDGCSLAELVSLLREKETEAEEEAKSIAAMIMAGTAVSGVADDMLRSQEKEIIARLASPVICDFIEMFTGVYNGLGIDDGRITVKAPGRLPCLLSDLSTGAFSQILLAIRCGIAMQLSPGPLFFILDDAFIFSDWSRRPVLVRQMADLVQNGWQVIYFTMDDHIRDLFVDAGKSFDEDFKLIKL